MLNETNIQCFLILARTLSFTGTARELFMTQQSVSKHIARLESELGFPLFVRSHHHVVLTPGGERLREMLERFRGEFRSAVEECRADYGQRIHTLRVGYLEWIRLGEAPAHALARLKQELPETELAVERYAYGTLGRLFCDGALSLIVTYESFAPKVQGAQRLDLLTTPKVILASPAMPRAVKAGRWTELDGEVFLCAGDEGEKSADTEARARQAIKVLGIPNSSVQLVPNRETAYQAAELGQGIIQSTNLAMFRSGYNLKAFETDRKETLICLWRGEGEGGAAGRYARYLQQAYAEYR